MTTNRRFIAAALVLVSASLHAQPKTRPPARPATVPVVFLSDIHFDPYSDPAKVPQLITAPLSEWGHILGSADSPTRAADFTALEKSCNEAGIDADDRVLQSALSAIHAHARGVRAAIYAGDFLAHAFECKYRKLAPKQAPEQYREFTVKTVQYVVSVIGSALPGVPVYFTLGNNDSGCADYSLDPSSDPFLATVGPILAESQPAADRASVAAGIAAAGHYSALLPAPFVRTRIVSMDDLYLSERYAGCPGAQARPEPAPAAAQLEWLDNQLSRARAHHERVWFISHIPPGVNIYATGRKMIAACSAASVTPFLSSNSLAASLAENSDIIPLALFGHTHFDEIHFLSPDDLVPHGAAAAHARSAGIPVKIIPPISPINGDPAFIVGQVRPSTATLVDYTVFVASDKTGVGSTWKPSYTYSARYRKRAFNSASVRALVQQLQADHTLASRASQAYVSSVSVGIPTPLLQLAWTPYTCSLSHTTTASFTACACGEK
jgi:sphingomyelin phosphodiesterase acid-like 3